MKNALLAPSVAFLLVTALAGCELLSEGPTTCPAVVEPAIVVEVQNQNTGEYIGTEVEGYITDGSKRDSLRKSGIAQTTPTLIVESLAAGSEGGTYDVYLESTSYESWSRKDVEVDEGECGAETVKLEAKLRPVE
jgi:predicted small lipoprotein YifL